MWSTMLLLHTGTAHLESNRDLETVSINTCKLHGSPKVSSSKTASPHHHRLSRVQTLDLMDDVPLPFQTGDLNKLDRNMFCIHTKKNWNLNTRNFKDSALLSVWIVC